MGSATGLGGGGGGRSRSAASGSVISSRALKAESMRPPLALRTALMTASSTDGKASLSICWFFCASVRGRGGFGGGASPEAVVAGGFAAAGAVEVDLAAASSAPSVPCS